MNSPKSILTKQIAVPFLPLACALMLTTFASSVAAQACKDRGDLSYIGRTSDDSRSVWMSTTEPGSFALEAAQGNTRVDTFTHPEAKSRVSLSPFVSGGAGGTHRLFELGAAADGGDCLVETQNQSGGIVLPPVRPPGPIRPPIGHPIEPPPFSPPNERPPGIPTEPPTGGRPPIERPIERPGDVPAVPIEPPTEPPVEPPVALPAGGYPDRSAPPADRRTETSARCLPESDGKFGPVPCDPTVVPLGEIGVYGAPITPGRDLGPRSDWNIWTDIRFMRTEDDRDRRDAELKGRSIAVGVDRFISENIVVGLQFEYEKTERNGFDGIVQVDGTNFSIGPYVAARLSERWSADAMISLGQVSSDISVANLSGYFDRTKVGASVSAVGQYKVGSLILRPKASVDYVHLSSSDFTLDGTLLGAPVQVSAEVQSGWMTTLRPSVEVSRILSTRSGLIMPYTEVGAEYSFGETTNSFSPSQDNEFENWAGTMEAGIRLRARNGLFVDASVGYTSLFVSDLDAVDFRVSLSWNF